MTIRTAMIAISAAATAVAAFAQPGKDEQPVKAPKPVATAPVVLASASDLRRPSPGEGQRPTESVRRPTPRVTTCRCGDPQPETAQPDE